jgi:hypothetical protein
VAITEAIGRIPAVPRRAVYTVPGDRQSRLDGARVLPHHPATGRRCMAALASCSLIRPVVQLRQTPLSIRRGRSRRPSTAMGQRSAEKPNSFTKCAEEPLLVRHLTPLPRRGVVYFRSGAHITQEN